MRQNLPANPPAVDKRAGGNGPLSSLCHEVGLAAVAAELRLRVDDLDLDAADAVDRGAEVLRLVGLGPTAKESARRGRAGEEAGRRKTRRARTLSKRSRHPRTSSTATAVALSPIPEPSAPH